MFHWRSISLEMHRFFIEFVSALKHVSQEILDAPHMMRARELSPISCIVQTLVNQSLRSTHDQIMRKSATSASLL